MTEQSKVIEPTVDGYVDLRFIAQGSSGWLFAARQSATDAQVAIKVFRKELVGSKEAAARFEREIRALSQVVHPNIVKILDSGLTNTGLSFIATEFINGMSISTLLETEGVVDPNRAGAIAIEVCKALLPLHTAKIIHRDIKPSNIMLDENGNVKVIDFGIAKFLESSNDTITQYGGVIGTPAYMSPEQCLGQPVDERSDVYSLGCTLFEMLTGQKAFAAETAMQSLAKQIDADRSVIDDTIRSTNIAKDLQTITRTCLQRNAEDRYTNVVELETNVNDFLNGRKLTFVKRPQSSTATDPELKKTIKIMLQVTLVATGLLVLAFAALVNFSKSSQYSLDSGSPKPAPINQIDKTEFTNQLAMGVLSAGKEDLIYVTSRPSGPHFVTVGERLKLTGETALPLTMIPPGQRRSCIVGRPDPPNGVDYAPQRDARGWDGWQIRLARTLADEWQSKFPGKLQAQIRVLPDGRIDRVEIVACIPAVDQNGHFITAGVAPDLHSFQSTVERAIENVSSSRVLVFPFGSTAKTAEALVIFNRDKSLNQYLPDLRTMASVPLDERVLWRARICSLLDTCGPMDIAERLRASLPSEARHLFGNPTRLSDSQRKEAQYKPYWLSMQARALSRILLEQYLSDGRYREAEVLAKRICQARFYFFVSHEDGFVPQLHQTYDELNENYINKVRSKIESRPDDWGPSVIE